MIFFRLLLLFTLVPLLELWLLLQFASLTSAVWTILLVIGTGILGAALARRQGWQTWLTIQRQLSEGIPPTDALLDGLMILVAGAVLITPGLLTDLLGFALLIPPIRSILKRRFARHFAQRADFHVRTVHWSNVGRQAADRGENIIDAEFTREPIDKEDEDSQA